MRGQARKEGYIDVESSDQGCGIEGDMSTAGGELSTLIEVSCSSSASTTCGSRSEIASVLSEICLKMLFTAIIPGAPVSAARSAPTYPDVALASAL